MRTNKFKRVCISENLVNELDDLQRAIDNSFGIKINRVKASELYPKIKNKRGKSLINKLKELLI